jgi:hypothetical protein
MPVACWPLRKSMSPSLPAKGLLPPTIHGIKVVQRPIGRSGGRPLVPFAQPYGSGVLHTTEGWGLEAAYSTLAKKFCPSTFLVGDGQIVQMRPLGVQAAALLDTPQHPNQFPAVQVEIVGYTGGSLKTNTASWMPPESSLRPLLALLAYLHENGIVPLERPSSKWLDDCSDIKTIWAISGNTRRLSGVWPKARGWYGHLEVPGNNHYDVGALRWTELFAKVRELLNA